MRESEGRKSVIMEQLPILFSCVFLCILVLVLGFFSRYGAKNWLSFYLSIIMASILFCLSYLRKWNKLVNSLFYFSSFFAVLLLVLFDVLAFKHLLLNSTSVISIGHILCLFFLSVVSTIALYLLVKKEGVLKHPQLTVFIVFIFLFFIRIWFSLIDLPNWIALSTRAVNSFFAGTFFILLIALVWIICFIYVFFRAGCLPLNNKYFLSKMKIFIIGLIITIFAILSYRFDSLFLGSSMYHWEYYIGTIRSVRNGGLLLWDTPSQYGFLNILLASIIPIKSSWQSFYLLQGFLLLITSVIMYFVMLDRRKDWFSIIILGIITGLSMFYADPELIGPSLYPSSSVMRFFPSYLLLFYFYFYYKLETKSLFVFPLIGGLLWVFASFWSSENLIYSTAIFIPTFVLFLVQSYYKKIVSRTSLLFIAILPVLLMILSVSILFLTYKVVFGVTPDLYMHFEHAVSYAGGFGSVGLNYHGIVWLLILFFISLLALAIRQAKNHFGDKSTLILVACIFSLWSFSSYFIGRSVPNNVTALLPQLMLIAFLALNAASPFSDNKILKIPIKLITFSIAVIVILTFFGNGKAIKTVLSTKSMSSNVVERMDKMDDDLLSILKDAKVNASNPIIYYGYNAALPKWQMSSGVFEAGEVSWMSAPMQLLEEPILPERRELIFARYFARSKKNGGLMLHAKGQAQERFLELSKLIDKSYKLTYKKENEKWELYGYKKKTD